MSGVALLAVAAAGVAAAPGLASAHSSVAGPAAWTEPVPLVVLLLAAGWLYLRGIRRFGRWPVRWTAAALTGGGVVALALLPPLDTLAATSVTAHMAQHTLLIVVAAPLLALGRPLAVAAAALPTWRLARRLGTPRPGLAAAAHAVALWLWHLPPLYHAALAHPLLHAVDHTTLLGTAVFLWWSVSHGRARVVGALWLFVTGVHASALGALLALSPRPWFRGAELEDQQLAGLLMWVPAGIVLTAIALMLLGGWLRAGVRSAALGLLPAVILVAAASSACDHAASTASAMTGGEAARGRDAMRTYGCATCHTIPGVPGATGTVGPSLDQLARRSYVAGAPNEPDHLVRWLEHPRRIRPGTPMPEMGVSERDARDITAYLYTLR